MPRIVKTARGVHLDFDTIIIKNQLAQAPLNIEIARRKEFIDSYEKKSEDEKASEVNEMISVNIPTPILSKPPIEVNKQKIKNDKHPETRIQS